MRFASLLCMEYSCLTVHGFVHVDGSSIVTTYSSVFGPVRVQRSTKCRFSRDPMKSALGLKLVTSTTSVSPSQDRKSTRLNSSHLVISYAVFCLKKKKKKITTHPQVQTRRVTS